MQTNRKGRRAVISQTQKGTISKHSANLHLARSLLAQQEGFKNAMVVFKRIVAEYFKEQLPEGLLERIGVKMNKLTDPTFEDIDKIISAEVLLYRVNQEAGGEE